MRLLVVSHPAVIDLNQRVYRALEAKGHELAIVTPNRWPSDFKNEPSTPRRLAGLRAEMHPLPVVAAGSVPLHLYRSRVAKVVDVFEPDVMYVEEEPYSLAAWQWMRAAHRSTRTFFYSAQNIAKKYPIPIRLLERGVWRRSAGAIVVAEAVEIALRERGFAGPVFQIPLSVDVGMFCPGPYDPLVRAEFQGCRAVIGFVGRLTPEKGVRVLTAAFAELDLDDVGLLFVGNGPLAAEAETLDQTVVARNVAHDEVARYLRSMDLLVVPSRTTAAWREQFGRVVIEAAATGIPVIASDSGELPTLVRTLGSGVITPEGDPHALAHEIRRLIESPGLRMDYGRRGVAAVRNLFSVEAVAAQHELALFA